MNTITIGVCRESQPVPGITEYVFEEDTSNVTEQIQQALAGYDQVTLVFSDITPQMDAITSYCEQQDIELNLMQYMMSLCI